MSQVKDTHTPIKLFGWTITSVPHDSLSSSSPVCSDSSSSFSSSSPTLPPHMINSQSTCDNLEQDNPSPKISPNPNNESKETSDQHSEITTAATSEEKSSDMKKPDKILPCPRCNCLDTKFCYYNNYNVNQPRHFCRNCQRYWTSGGTLRTVAVGSGRRKNKGWVSSDHDHYQTITSDNTNNAYSNSATQFLSFEHQANEVKINADSISQEPDNFQEFLPQQVTPYAPSPWPNPSFYPMPVYWGYTTPVWSTLDTSTCLGKRTRDETSREGVREGKDAFVTAKFVPESHSSNTEASISTKSHVWYPVPTKRQKRDQFSFFLHGSETKRLVPQTFLNLHANPAAMARSINFRESM